MEKILVVIHLLALVNNFELSLFLFFLVFTRFFILDPYKLIKVGANEAVNGDPLIPIQKELADIKYVKVPGLPSFTGNIYIYK